MLPKWQANALRVEILRMQTRLRASRRKCKSALLLLLLLLLLLQARRQGQAKSFPTLAMRQDARAP